MKAYALSSMFALASFLLLFGCASAPAEPQSSVTVAPEIQGPQQPAAIPFPPAPNETQAAPLPEPVAPPAIQPNQSGCNVQFQKDASNVYYIMVKTAQAGSISVTCPNSVLAQKKGELYFCTQLDVPNPAIAHLDGVECGRAQFSQADSTTAASAGKQSCTVLLAPSRITVGETSTVTVKAYVPSEKSTLAYLCGDGEATEKVGGMVDTGKICRFATPGTIEVYAKVNGEVCATGLLTVFSNPKDCSVYGTKFSMDKNEYVYTATVAGRGYSSGDELRYTCYGIMHGIPVGSLKNSTDFVTSIDCRSSSGPLTGSVKVTLGGDACGEMALPG